jgi:TfoX/Sxy family transcriptional regulator of competence genes
MAEENKPTTPKWHAAPEELVRGFTELVRSLPGVDLRQMFGFPCAFFQGQMFAGLYQDGMILRLSEADRTIFLALDGATQFEPMPGRPMREYVLVPPAIIGQPGEVAAWLDRSLAYAASLPPKEPKKKGKVGK